MTNIIKKIRGTIKKFRDYLNKKIKKFPEFKSFHKIPRYSRDCIITEKIDGTNGLIYIDENNNIFAGSKNRWLWGSVQKEIQNDNHGFAKWVKDNKEELLKLGKGYHYGEWMGKSIQRTYGLKENRFYLFNQKWNDDNLRPKCCYVVPIISICQFKTEEIEYALTKLIQYGSYAIRGYTNPEGIVIFHKQSGHLYKKTIIGDEKSKGIKDETV